MTDCIKNSTIALNNIMFKEDISYREAYLDLDINKKIDTRFMESKSDQFTKYFLTRPNEKIPPGSYVTTKDGTFLVTHTNLDEIFSKAESLVCNQIFRCKGLKDMPFNANNTTYGVKGLKDNGVFKEPDAKLKAIIQANDYTCKYKVGMRVLFEDKSSFISSDKNREWIAYKVLKKDYTVLENQYIMELEMSSLSPIDDLVNGIANNENISIENQQNKFKIYGKSNINIGDLEKFELDCDIKDIKFEIKDDVCEIVDSSEVHCVVKGKSKGISTLYARISNNVISKINILVG